MLSVKAASLFCIIAFCVGEYLKFPSDFKFGLSTASYQIEGGWNADGKGVNIWDEYTHNHPELVSDHSTGDVACDSYHLWKEDVNLLKEQNVDFYRFSLSWSRILPRGTDNYINKAGVRYYNNIIDLLLKNKIEPMVTLYHWDLPQPLQDLGGWTNDRIAIYFEQYANVSFSLFGDRVKTWVTINEPKSVCLDTYNDGKNAPGIASPGIGSYLCGRTVLLAHARAYHLYDNVYRPTQNGEVSIVLDTTWAEPKTDSPADLAAASKTMQMEFGWWAHPIYSKQGDYPDVMKQRIADMSLKENFTESRLPPFTSEEVSSIRGTFDFFGLNHYTTVLASDQEYPVSAPTSFYKDLGVKHERDPRWKKSKADWLYVVPWGFRKLLNWIKNEYGNPKLYVTENGYADDGQLHDQDRISYHKEYLQSLLQAIIYDGCKVKKYSAWSLMDNMEWSDGYTLKFGLHRVNFNSSRRTRAKKSSSYFYKKVILTRTIPPERYQFSQNDIEAVIF